jgi:hypothetical protein
LKFTHLIARIFPPPDAGEYFVAWTKENRNAGLAEPG